MIKYFKFRIFFSKTKEKGTILFFLKSTKSNTWAHLYLIRVNYGIYIYIIYIVYYIGIDIFTLCNQFKDFIKTKELYL